MTTHMPSIKAPRHHRADRRRDRLEYRALVAVSFLPCLVVATLGRLGESAPHRPAGETIFAEALSSARAAAGYALIA
ncbi:MULTISPECIES: hypothetical protein [unclassified Roseitalea]|uniref:hypothetical protein n=1 Tax=unclassified Roseitalea TaxID=2639107 RepID=UPI00273E4949|nr:MULTISPECIES: hypothetical protein [unclassified Roseitalea]